MRTQRSVWNRGRLLSQTCWPKIPSMQLSAVGFRSTDGEQDQMFRESGCARTRASFPGDPLEYYGTRAGRIIVVDPTVGRWMHIGWAMPADIAGPAWIYFIPGRGAYDAFSRTGKSFSGLACLLRASPTFDPKVRYSKLPLSSAATGSSQGSARQGEDPIEFEIITRRRHTPEACVSRNKPAHPW